MSAPLSDLPVPCSILDTDLYKLSMQQAVLQQFPTVHATYRFTNRNASTLFTRQSSERFRTAVSHFTDLTLTDDELQWLRTTCPYFTEEYLAYLSAYRYKPEQVKIKYIPVTEDNLKGRIEISISGPWVEAILWEVPLMACLSETYFQLVDTDWSYDGQDELAYTKASRLFEAGCRVSEFGTRRRRSFKAQDIILEAFVRASRDMSSSAGGLAGTSNVHLARLYNLPPIGTIAHEWFMGVAALEGYENANSKALKLWEDVFLGKGAPLIALTDTFATETFLKDFATNPERVFTWDGLRQDSGDPFAFGPRVKAMYESLNIPYQDKLIVYSDALNTEKCLAIKKQSDELGFKKVSFGIGTFLSNDFRSSSTGEKSKALNIVIKLSSVNDNPCIKLSDDLTKTTGPQDTVDFVKRINNLK
ncbi:nicotinate phosphoribosyltransferase [Panaeolus papilionaceus]|nr:nicotinate phosphoribosyltransferase [Panaeolus papilionaceus]